MTEVIEANGQVSVEEAKKALSKEITERTDKCKKEVQELLEKSNCTLDVSVIIKAGAIIPRVDIISK